MHTLDDEIAAYQTMKPDLEAHHFGKWAVIKHGALVGAFTDFQDAAAEAVRRFGRGPYLIREIGSPPVVVRAPMVFVPAQ
jgi:hypothetical protein